MDFGLILFIFILGAFLGRELIAKVPSQLHTPLMSATNAISGITLIGAIIVCANSEIWSLSFIFSFVAIILATINIVGGYMVTERMLGMFKKKEDKDK